MNSQCPPDNAPHPSDCQTLERYRTRARERAKRNDSAEMRLLAAKAEPIRLLLLDVDGVLTDGSLIYTENGIEGKSFHTQDGLGIRLLQRAGVDVGLITGRSSDLVTHRAQELGMKFVFQGVEKKIDSLKKIIKQSTLKPYQICYMGDDWIDLPLLVRVGLAACPANSVPEVRDACHFVTLRSGGSGAVREVCDLIILAKGARDNLLQQYMS